MVYLFRDRESRTGEARSGCQSFLLAGLRISELAVLKPFRSALPLFGFQAACNAGRILRGMARDDEKLTKREWKLWLLNSATTIAGVLLSFALSQCSNVAPVAVSTNNGEVGHYQSCDCQGCTDGTWFDVPPSDCIDKDAHQTDANDISEGIQKGF